MQERGILCREEKREGLMFFLYEFVYFYSFTYIFSHCFW